MDLFSCSFPIRPSERHHKSELRCDLLAQRLSQEALSSWNEREMSTLCPFASAPNSIIVSVLIRRKDRLTCRDAVCHPVDDTGCHRRGHDEPECNFSIERQVSEIYLGRHFLECSTRPEGVNREALPLYCRWRSSAIGWPMVHNARRTATNIRATEVLWNQNSRGKGIIRAKCW